MSRSTRLLVLVSAISAFLHGAHADEQKFSPPSQLNDSYGQGLASAGGLLFIGSRGGYLPDNQNRSGYVELYTRGPADWLLQKRIVANENTVGFGGQLAIDGDWLVVKGSLQFPNPLSVYVFHRAGSEWMQVQRIDRAQGSNGSDFGEALALRNGHLLVGAMDFDAEGGTRTGHVYAYELTGNSFVPAGEIARPFGTSYDRFGQAMAFAGDRLIIGAPDFTDAAGIGAVFTYVFQQGQWIHLAALRPDIVEDASFGAVLASCAAAGQLAIGARSGNAVGSSAVGYIEFYEPITAGWRLARSPLRPQLITAPVEFPSALACEGPLLAAVAAGTNHTYSFRRVNNDWQEAATYSSSDPANAGFFRGVVISDRDVVVSDERQESGIYPVGAVYAFNSDSLFADSFE